MLNIRKTLAAEYNPQTPTEALLVQELADAQHKLAIIAQKEQALLDAGDDEAVLKLDRYAQSVRRNLYNALDRLTKLQASRPTKPQPQQTAVEIPMPSHLKRELDLHLRRDPLFHPTTDASQMSKELRKWFDRNPEFRRQAA